MDARRHPRYKLEVDVRIYPRDSQVVRGHSVDISESGISALLRVEVPVGEVVRLEFTVPTGDVQIHALVRQRNAFRYGFQFLEAISPARDHSAGLPAIGRLAVNVPQAGELKSSCPSNSLPIASQDTISSQ
jgi:PilZ domain-containing protein